MFKKTVSVLLAALLLCGIIPMSALQAFAAETGSSSIGTSPADYPSLTLGTPATATVNEENPKAFFRFVPTESCHYAFYSTGDNDTYGNLYNSEMTEIASDDDSGTDYNFRIESNLAAGEVYYLSAGFYSSAGEGSFEVTAEAVPYATSLAIEQGNTLSGYPSYGKTLNAQLLPEGSAKEALTWQSADESVVQVDSDGYIRLRKAGKTTVTVTSEHGLTASCEITVKPFEVLTVTQPVTADIPTSGNFVIMTFVAPETATYIFASSGAENITYADFGELDGDYMEQLESVYADSGNDFTLRCSVSAGKTYYLRTGFDYDYDTGSFQVTAAKAPAATGMAITQGTAVEGYKGESMALAVSFTPEGAQTQSVTWTCSDSSIVSVDQTTGSIELLKEGTATVTAQSEGGLTAACQITVKGYETIRTGESKEVTIDTSEKPVTFCFVPDATATYSFYSTGNGDTVGSLCDADMNELYYDDDSGEDSNFNICCELTKGTIYYLRTGFYGSSTGTFTLTAEKNVPATAVTIKQGSAAEGYPNTSLALTAAFLPAGAIPESVAWSSSDESVAEVDDGTVTLKAVGSAVITVTSENGLTASCTVTVRDYAPIALDEEKTVSLLQGQEAVYRFIPSETREYVFYSTGSADTWGAILDSDMDIFTSQSWGGEDDNFRLTVTLNEGETYYLKTRLYNSSDEGSYHVILTAIPYANAVTIYGSTTGPEDGTLQLAAFFEPGDAAVESVVWSSSDASVASVNNSGLVSLHQKGTAVITVTSERGLTDSVTVTVTGLESIAAGDTKHVSITESGQSVTYRFVPQESREYVLYSSKSALLLSGALYDSNMTMLNSMRDHSFSLRRFLVANETYYYTCSFDGNDTGAYDVTLLRCPDAEQIEFANGGSVTGYPSTSASLRVSFLPQYAATESVSWSSSDESVASVKTGYSPEVRFHKKGTAIITATSERGLTATCTVTVKDYETLAAGETKSTVFNSAEDVVIYKITPTSNACYEFRSESNFDPYASLLDADGNELAHDDDSGKDTNFFLQKELSGGSTYYLKVSAYGKTETVRVSAAIVPYAETMTILQGEQIESYPHASVQLDAVFTPERCYNEAVAWTSSDDSVVTVDNFGNAQMKKGGTASITATSERGLTAVCSVTVRQYESLAAGETKEADFTYKGKEVIYRIAPDESTVYAFYSKDYKRVAATLYDDGFHQIKGSPITTNADGFRIKNALEKGKTYYLSVHLINGSTGSISVTAEKPVYVTELSVLTPPDRTTYVKDFVRGYVDYKGLSVQTKWSDGRTVVWTSGSAMSIRGEALTLELNGNAVVVTCDDRSDSFALNLIDNPVESIQVIGGSLSYVENTGGYRDHRYDPETDVYDSPFYNYAFNDLSDIAVAVHFKDGTSKTARVGSVLNGYKVETINTQYLKPWTLGSDNELTISYLGVTTTLPVTIKESPVESIEILGAPSESLIENADGYEVSTYNMETEQIDTYFNYYLYKLEGIPVRIHFKDGTVTDTAIGATLNGYSISVEADQREKHFSLSSDNEVDVIFMGKTARMNVTVEANPIEKIELLAPSSKVLYENAGGFVSNRYDAETDGNVDYYYYYLDRLQDTTIRIVYKDGTSVDAYPNDYINGYSVRLESDQYTHPYTLGGGNVYYVRYMGHTAEATVTVAPNPVESIELLDGFVGTAIEEVDGYWDTLRNNETGKYDIPYFRYTSFRQRDAEIKINYTDGSSVIAKIGDTVNEYPVTFRSDQNEHPWTRGGDNFAAAEYMGQTAAIPVNIVPNPVESIEPVKATGRTLIENGDGYPTGNDSESYFYYVAGDLSDAEIKINYTDGTSKTAHIDDIVDGYYVGYTDDQDETHWTRGSNNFVRVTYMGKSAAMPITVTESPLQSLTVTKAPSRQYVYGDEFYGGVKYFSPSDYAGLQFTATYKNGAKKTFTDADIKEGSVDDHIIRFMTQGEQKIGENTVTMHYMGLTADYNVTVRENTVSALTIVKLPDVPVYSRYYQPNWSGMKVKVTYTNGTSKTVTLSDSNIRYDFNQNIGFVVSFELDGAKGYIVTNNRMDNTRSYRLHYVDKFCDITGLNYRQDKLVTDVQIDDFAVNGENMLVTVTNEDGTTESIRLSDIRDCRPTWMQNNYCVRAMTDKGMLTFYTHNPAVEILYSEDAYDVNIFDINVLFNQDDILGDVNGDGKVTIGDATALQRYVAEFSGSKTARLLKCGDVNNDGSVNIRDVTCIQRYLLGDSNPYNIGEKI